MWSLTEKYRKYKRKYKLGYLKKLITQNGTNASSFATAFQKFNIVNFHFKRNTWKRHLKTSATISSTLSRSVYLWICHHFASY